MPQRDFLVLELAGMPPAVSEGVRHRFESRLLPPAGEEREALLKTMGHRVSAIACNGHGPVDSALLDRLPSLELIASASAGMEGVDVEGAKARGIKVTTVSGALDDECADVAISLILGLTRRTVAADRFVREGKWLSGAFPLGRATKGLKVGIFGLGHIGKAVARRLDVMGAHIAYHGRTQQDVAFTYFPTLLAMAEWCDLLLVAAPGGPATRHVVDADIIHAIGAYGWLVNISRGTIVDEAALAAALADDAIAGFGSDVFADEPRVPAAFINDLRTVLLPHYGSGTVQTRQAMAESVLDAIANHFKS